MTVEFIRRFSAKLILPGNVRWDFPTVDLPLYSGEDSIGIHCPATYTQFGMERCTQCNSTLAKREKVCWACASPVPEENPKKTWNEHFHTIIKVLFFIVTGLTVASLIPPLKEFVPSFFECAAVLGILRLVKSSADTMWEARK
jgi:hypothetical protein